MVCGRTASSRPRISLDRPGNAGIVDIVGNGQCPVAADTFDAWVPQTEDFASPKSSESCNFRSHPVDVG
jgi:hypothetical protein